MTATSQLNLDAIRSSSYSRDPYPHFLGSNFIKEEAIPALRESFPNITKPGYLLASDMEIKEPFASFVEELEGEELTEALSQRFGLNLHPFPRLTTIRKLSQAKDGRIHTDGPDKVMTMLVYMNDEWAASGDGRLRVLYNEHDFNNMKLEVPPTMGTVFGFLRADNSWHGHLPFTGERRVVQIAWIRSTDALARKQKRNRVSTFLKGIFGR